jgi:hypothetical protein
LQLCRQPKTAFSRLFASLLVFSVENELDKSQRHLQALFEKSILELIDSAGEDSAAEIDTGPLLSTLMSLGAHSKEALYLIWEALYLFFERYPKFLKLLWFKAQTLKEPHLQAVLSAFLNEDRAAPIWMISFPMAPKSKHQLEEVL